MMSALVVLTAGCSAEPPPQGDAAAPTGPTPSAPVISSPPSGAPSVPPTSTPVAASEGIEALRDAWLATVGTGVAGLADTTAPGSSAETWAQVWTAFAEATLADGIEQLPEATADVSVDGTTVELCAGEYGCSRISAVELDSNGLVVTATVDEVPLEELTSAPTEPIDLGGGSLELLGALTRTDGSLWIALEVQVLDERRPSITGLSYVTPDGDIRGASRGELRDPQLLRAGQIGTPDPPVGARGTVVSAFPPSELGGRLIIEGVREADPALVDAEVLVPSR